MEIENRRLVAGAVIAALFLCLSWSIGPDPREWPWSVFTYTPLVLYGTILCNLAIAWRLTALRGLAPRPGSPDEQDAAVQRLSRTDALVMLVLALLSLALLEHLRRAVNPEQACLGCDSYDYLQSIVALASGRWELYHGQRWLPYSAASYLVGGGLDVPYHVAAQYVSEACTALIPPLTYCAALPLLGRSGAALSSLLVVSFPHLQAMSLMTTSYPLYDLLFLLVVTTGVWAVVGGRIPTYAALGVSAAACLATQQQSYIMLPPVLAVACLRAFRPPWRSAALRYVPLFAPIAACLAITPYLPVRYANLSTLVIVQRCHLNHAMPYAWPAPLTPDPLRPSPLSPWLPAALRGGDLEALASVLLAPAHSRVLAFRGQPVRLEVVSDSTIPPLSLRLQANLGDLRDYEMLRETWDVHWLLVMLGGMAFVLRPPRGDRWGAFLVLTSLLPLASQVCVLFQLRWALWSVPLLAILMVNALQAIGDLCLASSPRPWKIARQGLLVWMALSLALTLLTGRRDAWLRPGLRWETVSRALAAQPRDALVPAGLAELRIARWIQANAPGDATIYDATSTASLLLWQDPRFVSRVPDPQRLCRKAVAAPPCDHPALLVAGSGFPWRTSASCAQEAFARADLWKPLYAIRWNPLQECSLEGMTELPPGALVIFGSTTHPPTPASPPP